MKIKPDTKLWQVVSHLENAVLKDWRNTYHANVSLEDALANCLMSVKVETTRFRGGNVSVTVSIADKQIDKAHEDHFRLQRAANRFFEVVTEDSTNGTG